MEYRSFFSFHLIKLLLLSFALVWQSGFASPMTPADWFCTRSEKTGGGNFFTPTITRIPERACAGSKEPAPAICSMSARCIFLTSQIKKDLSKTRTNSDREALIVGKYGSQKKDWFNSAITCKANPSNSPNGPLTCPPPELCKNDSGLSIEAAHLKYPESKGNPSKNIDSRDESWKGK
jgi:hypothetical protein